MASHKHRILFLVSTRGASSWYRCNVPGKELARRGHVAHMDVSMEPSVVYQYDVIVISNAGTSVGVQVVEYAKSIGKKVIADIDDDPWHMTEWNPNVMRWNDEERASVERILSIADRVTTTSSFLADWVRQFSRDVVILPNCLPREYWDVEKVPHDKTVIGWIGGHTHYNDLVSVAGPINHVLSSHPDVAMQVALFEGHPFEPKKRVEVLPVTVDLTAYGHMFSQVDIGIAPLVDDHFNRSKSDLKVLEYGAVGIPSVASKIVTYDSTIRHGENGFLASTPEEWEEHLTRLIEDEALRERMAAEARKTAESRFIDKNIGLWEKAYGIG